MSNQQAGFFIFIIGILMCAVSIAITIWGKKKIKKYDQTTDGKVISHKWRSSNKMRYPCAVVEYTVGGETYQCIQSYAMIYVNTIKRAKYDWELDEKYGLHSYVTSHCEHHVNPVTDWFPIGSSMQVHYMGKKPRKAYCGALSSTKFLAIIVACAGLGIGILGLLLMTLLA